MPLAVNQALHNLTSDLTGEKSAGTDTVNNAELGTPSDEKVDDESVNQARGDSEVQDGVKKIEAVATVWTKKELYLAYAGCVFAFCVAHVFWSPIDADKAARRGFSVFLIFFFNALQQQVTGNLTAYVTSSFSMHSLVSTISIVSNIVGGVFKLPMAKMLDIWGRAEVFLLMLTFTVIGGSFQPSSFHKRF
jgi:hypothetical protein